MTGQRNDSNVKSTKLRPAPYSQRRRTRINKTTLAAWISGIAGTVMFLLLFGPSIVTSGTLPNAEPSIAQNLLPTVTPTPMPDRPAENPQIKVDAKQIPYPVATPLSFSARAKFSITQTGVITLSANLRSGPGADFQRAGGVEAGSTVEIVDCNPGCDWYELPGDKWVAAWLVDTTSRASARQHAPRNNDLPEVAGNVSWGVVTASLLNVRSGPAADYAVVDFRAAGSCIPLLAVEDNWVQVPLSHETSGWAIVDYIKVVSSCPSTQGQMVISSPGSAPSVESIDAS